MQKRCINLLALALIVITASVTPAAAQSDTPPYRLFLPMVVKGPKVVVLKPVADAAVYENYPNENAGSENGLYVGYDGDPQSWAGVMRSFIRFDLPQNSSEPLQLAVLRVYFAGYADYQQEPRGITVWSVNRPWNEATITYANAPWESMSSLDIFTSTNTPWGYREVEVTNLVSEWLNGAQANNGFMLTGDEVFAQRQYAYRVFASRESPYPPELVLTFGK